MMDVIPIPLSASVLVDQELDRRSRLGRRGNILTGCRDVDEYVLLGGFERGSVVGVSVEEDEMGLLIGLQTIARLLVATVLENDGKYSTCSYSKAMIITMLPVNVLLPKLRHILVNQVSALQNGLQNVNRHVKQCLENISISMVFDVEGLQEVLGEIKGADSKTADFQRPTDEQPTRSTTEVLDSQDEDEAPVQPDVSSRIPEAIGEGPTEVPVPQSLSDHTSEDNTTPDLILVTHMSSLLNTLFMGRDKPSAHDTMVSLSSQLRHLARSPNYNGPLIMILNSTTTPSLSSGTSSTTEQPAPISNQQQSRKSRTTETTLRSIFTQQQGMPNQTKPSFGLVFTQLLDLHLLCTRVPRKKGDTTTSTASASATARDPRPVIGSAAGILSHRFSWVIEVLLDEMGVYDYGHGGVLGKEGEEGGMEKPIRRRCRERRWGAVEVEEGGVRIVGV